MADGEVNISANRVYLPVIMHTTTAPSQPGIYGKVTHQGEPIPGINLLLRFYDGSSWSTVNAATTQSDGTYLFVDPPALASGQRYYVRYQNSDSGGNVSNPVYLWLWYSIDIDSYEVGDKMHGGDFDIAEIALQSPGSNAIETLPTTFTWTPRTATPMDSYEFDLYDLNSDAYFYTDPPLGYVDSYTLHTLPDSFGFDTEYLWEVWVYAPDGGFGISYGTHFITFAGSTSGSNEQLFPTDGRMKLTTERFIKRQICAHLLDACDYANLPITMSR